MFKKYIIVFASFFCLAIFSCNNDNQDYNGSSEGETLSITIFYTNDEHGWFEENDKANGASGMIGLWKDHEGYDKSDQFLVISGGDMWTGPAMSTWFNGRSMVEIMNQMGYDGAAIGNHEFDFTVDTLRQRLAEMDFPLLAANLVIKNSTTIPDFVIPYTIITVNQVKVGIIGLASLTTPYSTAPANVIDYEFTSYEQAIEKYAPLVKDKGADIIMIAGHICRDEMEELLPTAKSHGISIIGGGHCHQLYAYESDGVLLMQSGSGMRNYIKIKINYNNKDNQIDELTYETVSNNMDYRDDSIDMIVDKWETIADATLNDVIGYCNPAIDNGTYEMWNLVTDSWLYTFPNADVSITNTGGIRQDIPQGNITVATIVGLLPFNNNILELELTGDQLIDCIDDYIIGGMTTINGNKLMDGTPIYSDSLYTVLTTDYLYSLSYTNFSQYDAEPYNTSVNYRQPLIDWIKSMNLSNDNPLNNYLDSSPRR